MIQNKIESINIRAQWLPPSEEDLILGLQLTFDSSSWKESIFFSLLLELKDSLESSKESVLVFPASVLEHSNALFELLSQPANQMKFRDIQFIERECAKLELWILKVIQNLSNLPREPKEYCKQIFFRSKEKIEIFERLCQNSPSQPTKNKVTDADLFKLKEALQLHTSNRLSHQSNEDRKLFEDLKQRAFDNTAVTLGSHSLSEPTSASISENHSPNNSPSPVSLHNDFHKLADKTETIEEKMNEEKEFQYFLRVFHQDFFSTKFFLPMKDRVAILCDAVIKLSSTKPILELEIMNEKLKFHSLLQFDLFNDVNDVNQGPGPHVTLPLHWQKQEPSQRLFHILIKDKPELTMLVEERQFHVPVLLKAFKEIIAVMKQDPSGKLRANKYNLMCSNLSPSIKFNFFTDKNKRIMLREDSFRSEQSDEQSRNSRNSRSSRDSVLSSVLSLPSKTTFEFLKLHTTRSSLNVNKAQVPPSPARISEAVVLQKSNILLLLGFFWVKIRVFKRKFYFNKPSYHSRLIIFQNDHMIEIFNIPKNCDFEFADVNNQNNQKNDHNEENSTMNAASILSRRSVISNKLTHFLYGKYNPMYLAELGGFTRKVCFFVFYLFFVFNFSFFQARFSLDAILSYEQKGKTEHDHLIEMLVDDK